MRFGDYLARLTAEEQRSLTDDLTLGCGLVAFAARLHSQDARTSQLLGALAVGYTALCGAFTALTLESDEAEALDTHSPTLAGCGDTLPPRWEGLLAGCDRATVGVYLQMAEEATRDVVRELAADADLVQVRECLQAAVFALAAVRDDALSHA